MAPALAMLLLQSQLAAEVIHAEDAQVIEAALRGYWSEAPWAADLYVPRITNGPIGSDKLFDPVIDVAYDDKGKLLPKVAFDPALRESLKARNAYPVPLDWFKPRFSKIKVVGEHDREKDPKLRYAQFSWPHMPGYSKDRTRAIVCFGFNWSIHWGQATVWLAKKDGAWKVTDIRDVHY